MDQYATLAKSSRIPTLKKTGNGAATANPVGSGYYEESVDVSYSTKGPLSLNCSTCVIYVNGNLAFKDSASQINVRALIITGNLDINYDDTPTVNAKIPIGAEKEYRYGTAPSVWASNFAATGEGGLYPLSGVRVVGYVYVGGNMTNSGGNRPSIVGTLDVDGTLSVNNVKVYYNTDVSTSIITQNTTQSLQKISWREVKESW